jgi:AraC-like DNA-binding protein
VRGRGGMRGSVTSVFSEPEEFQAAMAADGGTSFIFTGRGRFRARSTQVKLNRLRLLSVEESLPRIAFLRVPSDTIFVGLSIESHEPPIWGGIRADGRELITVGAGQGTHTRTVSPCRWGAIWLPDPEFIHYSRALTGAPIDVPPSVCNWRPPAGMGRQFRQLFLAAIRTTHARSRPVTDPEAAHGLEQQLIHLLVECLGAKPPGSAAVTAHRAADVMARFEALIRNQTGGGLSTPRIKAALDVSDRFLRQCCAEHLGMSPMAYLRRHRMQLANLALRQGAAPQLRVADVAKRFGFRHLGRFAGTYRELYGETPYETLQRNARRGLPDIGLYKRGRVAQSTNLD